MYVNGRQAPSESLSLNKATPRTCTIAYQTLFSGLWIHHCITGIQIPPVQFMKGSYVLVFDLTPDGCFSDGQTKVPCNGNIHIELKFEATDEAATILLFQEYDTSIQID